MPRKTQNRSVPVASAQPLVVPKGWRPQIGAQVPEFGIETTLGHIDFADWARDRWVVLFSHPAAMTPICTSEFAGVMAARAEFLDRGVRVMGLSASPTRMNLAWLEDLKRISGTPADFPLASDPGGRLLRMFDMIHDTASMACSIRKTIVIGPDRRIRLTAEYPLNVGRSTEELLRSIDALQTVETYHVGTGADWKQGEAVVAFGCATPALFPAGESPFRLITPYMVMVDDPRGKKD